MASESLSATEALFSESNTRFLVEVKPENAERFASEFTSAGVTVVALGKITEHAMVNLRVGEKSVLKAEVVDIKNAWLRPLDW